MQSGRRGVCRAELARLEQGGKAKVAEQAPLYGSAETSRISCASESSHSRCGVASGRFGGIDNQYVDSRMRTNRGGRNVLAGTPACECIALGFTIDAEQHRERATETRGAQCHALWRRLRRGD